MIEEINRRPLMEVVEALTGKSTMPWYKQGSLVFIAFWWFNTAALFWYGVLADSGPHIWFLVLFLCAISWIVTLTVAMAEES